jgi:hypothetical protein
MASITKRNDLINRELQGVGRVCAEFSTRWGMTCFISDDSWNIPSSERKWRLFFYLRFWRFRHLAGNWQLRLFAQTLCYTCIIISEVFELECICLIFYLNFIFEIMTAVLQFYGICQQLCNFQVQSVPFKSQPNSNYVLRYRNEIRSRSTHCLVVYSVVGFGTRRIWLECQ